MRTVECTSRPNCPCVPCGRVRLLLAQEEERALSDIRILAEDYVCAYLKDRKENACPTKPA